MREAAFSRKNKDKWKELESVINGNLKLEPDEISDLYIQLTDDLSYARTFYPKSKITQYLNSLSVALHQEIYRNKKEPLSRFRTFWTTELPLILFQTRKQLTISFFIFLIAAFIGAISAHNDPTFIRLILGDGYVNETLENIENGEPMAIYKSMKQMDMVMFITFNNIRVSFYAYISGIFLIFGTPLLLLYNGIMLGSFQYFFHQNGLLIDSVLSIWIHGTLEISAIIIAGSAGLVLANGILFPGTYKRLTSFVMGAKKGMKIVIGLVPVFIVAGILESFVTRWAPDLPVVANATIMGVSFIFIISYFVIYPILVHQKYANAANTEDQL